MSIEIFTRIGRIIKIKNTKTKSFSNENDTYEAVLVKTSEGDVKCLMFTEAELSKAEMRALKNPEDQLQQSWWSAILD